MKAPASFSVSWAKATAAAAATTTTTSSAFVCTARLVLFLFFIVMINKNKHTSLCLAFALERQLLFFSFLFFSFLFTVQSPTHTVARRVSYYVSRRQASLLYRKKKARYTGTGLVSIKHTHTLTDSEAPFSHSPFGRLLDKHLLLSYYMCCVIYIHIYTERNDNNKARRKGPQ